jgi:hypothetical protein
MPARRRFVSVVGVSLSVTGLVIALGLRSHTLAQKEAGALLAEDAKVASNPAPAAPDDAPSLKLPPELPGSSVGAAEVRPRSIPGAASEPATPASPSGVDDPEKAAQEFVDRTRQEAGTAIKSLSAEAEALRARLKKVEAGLKRWQTLQAALDQNAPKVGETKKAWKPKNDAKTQAIEPAGPLDLPPTEPPSLRSTGAPSLPGDRNRSEEPAQKK